MEQICKMCGGRLEIDEIRQIATCPYCDTVFPLSEKVEKTRQQWETWVQRDEYRNALQEAWQEKMAESQKLYRKTDRFWDAVDLPLQCICIGGIFFFAAMVSGWLEMAVKTIGQDPSLTGGLLLGWLFCLMLLLIPLVVIWLLWRWKARFGSWLQAKAAADFYEKELQLWHTVHSLENYQNGTIEEESYRRGSQVRRDTLEQAKDKDIRWKRNLCIGVPLLLGVLLGFCLNITML